MHLGRSVPPETKGKDSRTIDLATIDRPPDEVVSNVTPCDLHITSSKQSGGSTTISVNIGSVNEQLQ